MKEGLIQWDYCGKNRDLLDFSIVQVQLGSVPSSCSYTVPYNLHHKSPTKTPSKLMLQWMQYYTTKNSHYIYWSFFPFLSYFIFIYFFVEVSLFNFCVNIVLHWTNLMNKLFLVYIFTSIISSYFKTFSICFMYLMIFLHTNNLI